MKYHIITYGCQMNKSDSERIAAVLERIGYQPTSNMGGADLIVVNMCSVRQSAVDRVYGKIKDFTRLKAKNNNLKTVLTGCVLKTDLNKFKKHFDYLLPIKSLCTWPEIFKKDSFFFYNNIQGDSNYLKIQPRHRTNFRAFIPISNGCNNFCAYCVVPYTRGPEICRDYQEILNEFKRTIKDGFKEIWLLGQNVNSYQSPPDHSIDFAKILKMVNNIPGNFWIRFTSPHPKDFSDKLINAMAECEKVAEYINLPVQSGDNEILRRMNRPYSVLDYKNLVKKIRGKIPNIALSTDIIVGFPGETKKQFQNTVKLFREMKFDMAYIAQYSSRPGTAAAKMKDNVTHQEKERRDKVLTGVLEQTALENNKKYIGKIVEVLPEKSKNGFLIGKTRTYKTVKFESDQDLTGKFVKVKIFGVLPWGLKGKLELCKTQNLKFLT